MKKYIKNLTEEELLKVYHANEKLRNEVLKDHIESVMDYVDECLIPLKNGLSNWSVGTIERPYLKVNDYKLYHFMEGMKKAQSDYCLLPDDEAHLIDELEKAIYDYQESKTYSDEYYELEKLALEKAQNIADKVAEIFKKNLDACFGRKELENYFIEFYSEVRLNGTEYIQDESYSLYEDISYTKSYN